ncbi:hypothetical protein [Eikenella sp. HMSC061C02]|nr:hypothetical protein [Eikenella sp. HMSC061C02]
MILPFVVGCWGTPNMTPEQIEQQIVLGISKNMIDDTSAGQLNRMLFGQ